MVKQSLHAVGSKELNNDPVLYIRFDLDMRPMAAHRCRAQK